MNRKDEELKLTTEKKSFGIKTEIIILVLTCISSVIISIFGTYAHMNLKSRGELSEMTSPDLELGYSSDSSVLLDNVVPLDNNILPNALDNNCIIDGMNICTLYGFSITNNSNVVQNVDVFLNIIENTFTNLKYSVYEGTPNNVNSSSVEIRNEQSLFSTDLGEIKLDELSGRILPEQTKYYTILFYIERQFFDQTAYDANKVFNGGVKINTVSDIEYKNNYNFTSSTTCWDINENKLVAFHGIKDDGTIENDCSNDVKYYNGINKTDGYIINVPNKVGSSNITTIGDGLFMAIGIISMDPLEYVFNNYQNIRQINISEGITTIENSDMVGAFGGINATSFVMGEYFPEITGLLNSDGFIINLPESLTYIGTQSFMIAGLKSLEIPKNVLVIGDRSFVGSSIENITFAKNSNLTTIGDTVFAFGKLKKLKIPKSVETIGETAFTANPIKELTFEGATDGTSRLRIIGDNSFNQTQITSVIIPKSVETIGEMAFIADYYLKTVVFEGAKDNTSSLMTIGNYAFNQCNLGYTSINNPLILPSSISSIGTNVFKDQIIEEHRYLKYMGNNWLNFDNKWSNGIQYLMNNLNQRVNSDGTLYTG